MRRSPTSTSRVTKVSCLVRSLRHRDRFGDHPLGVRCDSTTELPAVSLRPGNAGANTAADHLDVLGRAITLTDLLGLSTWPAGMRVIVRREQPHPGAQLP